MSNKYTNLKIEELMLVQVLSLENELRKLTKAEKQELRVKYNVPKLLSFNEALLNIAYKLMKQAHGDLV